MRQALRCFTRRQAAPTIAADENTRGLVRETSSLQFTATSISREPHPTPETPALPSRCVRSFEPKTQLDRLSSRLKHVDQVSPICPSPAEGDFILMKECRVRTLTGKEIELDIEADYKVLRSSRNATLPFVRYPSRESISA